jgi:hypothetical protein
MADTLVPSSRTATASVVTIAATGFFALVMARLAFFELGQAIAGDATIKNAFAAALCGSAIAGGLLAAQYFDLGQFPKTLGNSFRACGVAAALAFVAQSWWVFLFTATAVGLSLGWLAVTLASGLRSLLGTVRLGRYLGMGTGLAYALCQVPWVFGASARAQVLLAGAGAIAGALAAPLLWPRSTSLSSSPDYKPRTRGLLLATFLTLGGIEAAVFYGIRYSPHLDVWNWRDTAVLWGSALTCLGVALLAGRALDRGWLGRSQAVAIALLAAASLVLSTEMAPLAVAQILHAAGGAIFATSALYYAARSGRPKLVAAMFGVAGCVGTAAGTSLAQWFGSLPPVALATAGAVVALALTLRTRWRKQTLGTAGLIALTLAGVAGATRLDTARPDAVVTTTGSQPPACQQKMSLYS